MPSELASVSFGHSGLLGEADRLGISRISRSSLAIVLSTLTVHIIHGLDTTPRLASTGECLVATLSARQAFLDHALGDFATVNKSTFTPSDLEQMTAYTSGWTDPGWAGLATVNMEYVCPSRAPE
jgi:hypothetical protein